MDKTVRSWIEQILKEHQPLLAIAVRQRAKFEGWLKFELAAFAESQGATNVSVEARCDDGGISKQRSDVTFNID